jgi:hypothetical protein
VTGGRLSSAIEGPSALTTERRRDAIDTIIHNMVQSETL